MTSFDVQATRYRNIEIYGTEGTLSVPDPNTFGGPVKIRGVIDDDWREIPMRTANIPQQRGIGARRHVVGDDAADAHIGRPPIGRCTCSS